MTGHVHEPHVVCPRCNHQIPLTESIAAPLLEAERLDFQKKLAAREAEFARKTDELRRQQDELSKARESIEDQIRQGVEAQRGQIAASEGKRAREQFAGDLDTMKQRLAESEQL